MRFLRFRVVIFRSRLAASRGSKIVLLDSVWNACHFIYLMWVGCLFLNQLKRQINDLTSHDET